MKCQKIVYRDGISGNQRLSILLGLVVFEDDKFLSFRTGRRTHRINKSTIIRIEDTEVEFTGDPDV